MFCSQCGARNEETDLNCAECGQPLVAPLWRDEPAASEQESTSRGPGRKRLLLALAAVLLLAAIGAAALFLFDLIPGPGPVAASPSPTAMTDPTPSQGMVQAPAAAVTAVDATQAPSALATETPPAVGTYSHGVAQIFTVTPDPLSSPASTWTPSVAPSPSPTPSDTPTLTPSPSNTPTDTPTFTPSPSNTPTDTPTATPTASNTPPTPRPTRRPPRDGDVGTANTDKKKMVYVSAGPFLMGATDAQIEAILAHCNPSGDSSDCERSWYVHEQPQHRIVLDAFWIDRTEVTNKEYRKCVRAGHCNDVHLSHLYDDGRANHPVVKVTWGDAKAYCQWVGKRLPTEAEWEKAARGTDQRIYPWGNAHAPGRLNYCALECPAGHRDPTFSDGYAETAPVGSFIAGASPYGAYDMAGNVWEWTSDKYHKDYYAVSPPTNPQGPDQGSEGEYGKDRVIRGGSWYVGYALAATTFRLNLDPGWRGNYQGFRCVVRKLP